MGSVGNRAPLLIPLLLSLIAIGWARKHKHLITNHKSRPQCRCQIKTCHRHQALMLASTLAPLHHFCYNVNMVFTEGVRCPTLHTQFFGPCKVHERYTAFLHTSLWECTSALKYKVFRYARWDTHTVCKCVECILHSSPRKSSKRNCFAFVHSPWQFMGFSRL